MLQRFPFLRGRLLYLLRHSSLTSQFATARLLSSDTHNWKNPYELEKKNEDESKGKKFWCSLCQDNCKFRDACENIKSNFKYYASATALLLAAGLVFTRRKRKSAEADDSKIKGKETSFGKSESAKIPGPFEHDKVPEEIPYLLIGAGTASYYAALTIRARDADAKILMIGDERHLPYNRPNLTKELWWYGDDNVNESLEYKSLSGRTKEVYYETKGFYVSPAEISSTEHGGVSLLTGHRVIKLDIPAHIAYLDDGRKIKYGKCLIATGLSPCNLPIFEEASPEVKKKVSLFQTVDDFKKLYGIAKEAKSITVVGGNILASELAYSLNRRFAKKGLTVNQLFKEKGIVSGILPEYLSKIATDKARNSGINIVAGEKPVQCTLNENGQVKLVLTSGEELLSDHVVVIAGVEPNTELAASSNMEVDKVKGGFLVDAELRARTDVWVAGSVCNYYDVRLGRRRAELWDDANVTGRLAGENMTGGQKPYWHQAAFYTAIAPGVHFQGIGRTESTLPTISVFASDEGESDKVDRGVVFYLEGKTVVGILLYNIFGYGADVARRIIADGRKHEEADLKEIAKLFELHKAKEDEEEENIEEQVTNAVENKHEEKMKDSN